MIVAGSAHAPRSGKEACRRVIELCGRENVIIGPISTSHQYLTIWQQSGLMIETGCSQASGRQKGLRVRDFVDEQTHQNSSADSQTSHINLLTVSPFINSNFIQRTP